MLEQLFTQPRNTGSRPPISTPARKQQSSLEAFLRNQQFGSRIAGNTPAATRTVASQAPAPFSPEVSMGDVTAAPGYVDPSAISDFYADPSKSDYHNDPALLAAHAADDTTRGNADSAALKARRQLLAQFGNRDLASSVLGQDDPTLGAVSADPDTSTSMLARLARSYRDTVAGNEDARNKGNLWYSSARAEGLNNDARDYATLQADAASGAQSGLDTISSNLANAKSGASQSDAQAESEAFSRYLAAIAAHPPSALPTGGAGAGAGSPSFYPGGAPTATAQGDGSTMPFKEYDGTPVLPGIADAFEQSAGVMPTMAFTQGPPDTNGAPILPGIAAAFNNVSATPLEQYLAPKKKPVSGYGAASGSSLH